MIGIVDIEDMLADEAAPPVRDTAEKPVGVRDAKVDAPRPAPETAPREMTRPAPMT